MDLPPEQLASIQYQQENITDSRIPEMIGVAVALWALATVAVAGRFYAERMLRNRFKLHDALIVAGLVWFTKTSLLFQCTDGLIRFSQPRWLLIIALVC